MRTQAKIYTILIVFFWVIITPKIKCQTEINTSVLFVSARNGLILRKSPTVNSEKIISGKYGQAVQPIEIVSDEIKLNDRKGKWIKVNLNDKIGYMFSGYLSKLPRLENELISIQINNINLDDPIRILSRYFRLVLFEIREREVNTIKDCGNDPDCKNGIFQEIRYMNKEFSFIETTRYELYEEEIVGVNWSYDDAMDLVNWIVYPLWKDEVEIGLQENSCTYTKREGNLGGFVRYINIKKITEDKTSISWGGYH